MSVQYLIGDVFDRMAELEDGSVDLILTSPPFLALRSYLPADHPDKSKEIGSEATPAEYIDVLLRLTTEWRRLLAPHGSLCVELGDTYSGAQPPYRYTTNHQDGGLTSRLKVNDRMGEDNIRSRVGPGWPLAKSLTLIPEAYRFALAYGINPHTGQPSPAGQWRVRNVIRWVRPNPPVGALGDKFRPATSELVVACVSKDRYFDLDAVRDVNNPDRLDELDSRGPKHTEASPTTLSSSMGNGAQHPAGAPPLDWWKISPKGYAGAHYAVWPSELCVKPIKAMCPERVCRTCGQPSRRITGSSALMARQPELAAHIRERRIAAGLTTTEVNGWFPNKSSWTGHWESATSQPLIPTPEQWVILKARLELSSDFDDVIVPRNTAEYEPTSGPGRGSEHLPEGVNPAGRGFDYHEAIKKQPDLGWSDCGHDNYRPGLVLDPFAGTGTTLAVAHGHGRDAIGIDIDPRSAELARDRVGPLFLEVHV